MFGVSGHDGGVSALEDLHSEGVVMLCLKWQSQVAHFVEDDAEGPDIAEYGSKYLLYEYGLYLNISGAM